MDRIGKGFCYVCLSGVPHLSSRCMLDSTFVLQRAQVGKGLESSYENLKLGQNVRVQLTDMFQDSEDESYWLLDCKLVEQDNNQLLDETV